MKMKLSILIMVGCAYIYLFRTSFASSSELEIIFDFVKQLKRFSDDMTDFVSKIQAIFCPDQPICGSGGVHRDRSDILTTLPTDLNVSGTVVPLEELSEFMGVCCLPCSCENSCHEKENCCPTKVLQEDG